MSGYRRPQKKNVRDPEILVVAIDFGTTYSGVAWIHTKHKGQTPIQVMNRWPSRHAPQVRSEIEYSPDGRLLRWGYLENPTKRENYRFMLLKSLLAIRGMVEQREALEQIFGSNCPQTLTMHSVVQDYIKTLLNHALDQLNKMTLGEPTTTPLNEIAKRVDFVITFPACWSPGTIQEYKDILEGLDILKGSMLAEKVHYLREPEAAMIGTLHTQQSIAPVFATNIRGTGIGNSKEAQGNERFAILDVGGGTLDFSDFTVSNWDPFEVKKLQSTGDQLGGSDVDKAFWTDFVGRLAGMPSVHWKTKSLILREFERVKHCFPEEERYIIPLPRDDKTIPFDSPSAGIQDGQLCLTRAEMQGFFDLVINQIINFMGNQKKEMERERSKKKIKTLILVGGFGDSKYLQDRVSKWVSEELEATFIAPPESWTAVVIGAARYGLYRAMKEDGPVKTTISRLSIGVVTDIPWKRGIHGKDLRGTNPGNKKVVKDQIKWLVKRGDEVKPDAIRIRLEKTFHQWPQVWIECLVQSGSDSPSMDLKAPDIRPFGVVKVNVKNVPTKERVKNHSFLVFGKFFTVRYNLELSFPGADLIARMNYRGKCYGKAELRFSNIRDPKGYESFYEEGGREVYEDRSL